MKPARGFPQTVLMTLLTLLAWASLLPAQESPSSGSSGTADLVVFSPLNASVELEAWDRDSIRWTTGDTTAALLEAQLTGDVLELLERRRAGTGHVRVAYRLRMPRSTRVRIRVRIGSISVVGLEAGVRASVQEGRITVSSAGGSVELRTVDGPITVRDAHGNLDAGTVAGEILLDRVEGRLRAINTSGDITIRTGAPVSLHAESYSGRVRLEGSVAAAEGASVHSHSGAVELEVEPLPSGSVFLRTVRGDVDVRCPGAETREHSSGRRLDFGGGGGSQVELTTFSGPIRIRCLGS